MGSVLRGSLWGSLSPLALARGAPLSAALRGVGGSPTPTPPGPDITTAPFVDTGIGDSIIGGSAPTYYSFLSMAPGSGYLLVRNKGRPGQSAPQGHQEGHRCRLQA